MKLFYAFIGLLVVSSLAFACTLEEQEKANNFHKQAYEEESFEMQIKRLDQSLSFCYSPAVSVEKYLWQGDYFYDENKLSQAKNNYDLMLSEIDNIQQEENKKHYLIIYFKSMQNLYLKMNEQTLSEIMKFKYLRAGGRPDVHKEYVDADGIYDKLNVSETEKKEFLRSAGVAEKRIHLSINFNTGSSTLTHEGKSQAKALGSALRKMFQSNNTGMIKIIGYTDTQGGANYNYNLSKRRANTIQHFLNQYYEIDLAYMNAMGRGENSPICYDEFETISELNGEFKCAEREDKKASRRVEVRLRVE